jgi:predicted dehydrogenase
LKNNQIGIIGVGYWGTNIINVLYQLGIKKIYCFDNDHQNQKEIRKKFPKINVISNFTKFLELNLSGVIISVDTKNHFSVASKCLKNGFNIFIEKPSTNSSKKLQKLNKIAVSKKLFIMSGYIYFYNDYIKYIKKIIKKRFLGKIFYISCERLNLGPVRSDISSAWDLSSHDIAICNYLFDDNLSILNAEGYDFLKKKINDISFISAKIKDIKIDLKASWLNPEKVRKMIILGKKRMLLFDELDFKNPIKIYNKYATYPKIQNFKKGFFTQKANIFLGSTLKPKIKSKSPLENEMIEFIKCINHKKKPISLSKSINILKTLEKLN